MIQVEHTEVSGRWPTSSHWKWYALSDVLTNKEVVQGKPAAQEKKLVNDAGTVPIILSGDLRDIKEIHTSNRILQADVQRLKLDTWDKRVLLVAAARENMGQVGIFAGGQKMTVNNVVHVLDPDEKWMLLDFLFYYFLLQQTRTYLQEELAPNSTFITPTRLGEAKVVVPPLPEQQRIVDRIEALTYDLDHCLSLLYKQHEDTCTVIELALQQTFSPKHVTAWTGSAIGEDLFTIISHPRKIGTLADAQYYYIRDKNIEPFTGRLAKLKTLKEEKLPEDRSVNIVEPAQPVMLYSGDHTNHELSGRGKVCMLQMTDTVACHRGLWPLVMNQHVTQQVLPRFVFWSLLATSMRPGDLPVTQAHLKRSPIPFPKEIYRQTEIVNRLDAVQETVRKMREKQDEEGQRVQQMKQQILEKAFRGML